MNPTRRVDSDPISTYPSDDVGTRYNLPLSSFSVKCVAFVARASATIFSISAACCADSNAISRGELVMPIRMSTRQGYDMPDGRVAWFVLSEMCNSVGGRLDVVVDSDPVSEPPASVKA